MINHYHQQKIIMNAVKLKSLTRHDRAFGSLINFDGNSEFTTDFKDNFMKNPKNKENLNHFLAKKFLEIRNKGIIWLLL